MAAPSSCGVQPFREPAASSKKAHNGKWLHETRKPVPKGLPQEWPKERLEPVKARQGENPADATDMRQVCKPGRQSGAGLETFL